MKCVYCCKEIGEGEFAREHIPPKSFFKRGTPNLITIPACRNCNNKKSSDDELVLNIFCMSDLISINPAHQIHIDKMIRAIKRPQKEGFVKDILESVHTVVTPDGDKTAFIFDQEKILSWSGVNAQGLLVHEGYIEHCNYQHSTLMLNQLRATQHEEKIFRDGILSLTKSSQGKQVGSSEFTYWVYPHEDSFVVIQCFYQELYFVTTVEHEKFSLTSL